TTHQRNHFSGSEQLAFSMDNIQPGRTPPGLLDDEVAEELPQFCMTEGQLHNERNERTWRCIFSSSQGENETVKQYSNRIIALADTLTDVEAELKGPIVFFRVKAGLRDSIKQVINAQDVQPTSHAALNDVAMAIERGLSQPARPELPSSAVKNYPQDTAGNHRPLHQQSRSFASSRGFEQSQPLTTTANERSERARYDTSESTFAHDNSQATAWQDKGHYNEGHYRQIEKFYDERRANTQYGLGDDHEESYEPSSTFIDDTGRSSQPIELPSARQASGTRNDGSKSTSIQIRGRGQIDKSSGTGQKRGQAGSHQFGPPFNPEHGQPSRSLSPQEIERRKEGNLCFYCGQPGHMKGECPQNPQPRRKRQKSRR
ncbi:MAG: hypothetical protein Q9184_008004, partial [Pyrenodesmia sp. 2 TL-2023]